jgi:hypothetical protein
LKPNDLEKYLHEHIPISQHMGIQVVRADLECVTLSAPLEPNITGAPFSAAAAPR